MCHDVAIAVVVRTGRIDKISPKFAAIHACTGQIGKNHTESNGQKQQRFEALLDGKIEQVATHCYHYEVLPTLALKERDKAHLVEEIGNTLFHIEISRHGRCSHEKHQGNEGEVFQIIFHK